MLLLSGVARPPLAPVSPHPPALPPIIPLSPWSVTTPASDIICRGGRIGLSPLVLIYLDVEIIISELGFHIYLLKYIIPTMSLKYAHLQSSPMKLC